MGKYNDSSCDASLLFGSKRGGGRGGGGYYLISKLNAVSNGIMNGYLAVEDEF